MEETNKVKPPSKIEEREEINEIKIKLIAQEHRTWSLFKNLHQYAFTKDKKRSRASILAFIFNFLFSKSTIAIAFTGIIGYYFAWKNLNLIEHQNFLLKEQSYLSEANRRSSLVFLSSNVFDKIDEELKKPNNKNRVLSEELVGRISSLSYAYKPYKYLDEDQLTKKITSPERGQLLITLVNSKLDKSTLLKIYNSANFDYSDLDGAKFIDACLEDLVMNKASLVGSKFIDSNLQNISFTNSNLENSHFSNSNLNLAFITNSNLFKATFYQIDSTNNTSFAGSVLDSISLNRVAFDQFNLNSSDFSKSRFIRCKTSEKWIKENRKKNKEYFDKLLKSNSINEIRNRTTKELQYYISSKN